MVRIVSLLLVLVKSASGQSCVSTSGLKTVGEIGGKQCGLRESDCCARCFGQGLFDCVAVDLKDGCCIFYKSASGSQPDGTSTKISEGVAPTPSPTPPPTPAPTPAPPPTPVPPGQAFPSGDGSVTSNFFISSQPWKSTDGSRIQTHSGQVFQDKVTSKWVWIGNSDEFGGPGGGQHTQISFYRSDNLYGPWEPHQVLLTLEQAREVLSAGTDLVVLERPKIYQDADAYYLFVHLDNKDYHYRSLSVFKMQHLSAPSPSNPWTVAFNGRPSSNKHRGGAGFEVLDFGLHDDVATGELLYAAATDSYVFLAPYVCDTDPACTSGADCQMCANTAVVVFSVDKAGLGVGKLSASSFTPRAALPGRWEGMAMFRKPGDKETLYMMCSGQDGWGPNPISLFAGVLAEPGSSGRTVDWEWPAPTVFACLGQPHSGSGNGFNSQPFQVLQNPYSDDHAIYLGDNWLHGPGKDTTTGNCNHPSQPSAMEECEPWQGNCPCGWPGSNCPATSNPGNSAGYVWLSFPWDKLGSTDYLICAHGAWDMHSPPGEETCYTFALIPDPSYTPDFEAKTDYEGKPAPYIPSSCGFAMCPGWPLSPSENTANSECCQRLVDSLTQAKYVGICQRDSLCGGVCKETEFGNIPGGHAGCQHTPFDPSKASLIGGSDCTSTRGGAGAVVDPCRGSHSIPSFLEYSI